MRIKKKKWGEGVFGRNIVQITQETLRKEGGHQEEWTEGSLAPLLCLELLPCVTAHSGPLEAASWEGAHRGESKQVDRKSFVSGQERALALEKLPEKS